MEMKACWGILFFSGLVLRINSEIVKPICLETAIKFGLSDVACDITVQKLQSWFEEPPHGFPCEEQCSLSVTLDYDVSVAVSKLRFQVHGDLKRTLNLNRKCLVDDTVEVIVDCSPSAFKAYSGLICSEDMECGKSNAYCSTYGDTGRCMCDNGFLLINGYCRKVGLIIGDHCDINEQCTGSANSGNCLMSKCDCRSGYYRSGSNCYPNEASLGQFCIDDTQCSRSTDNSCCNAGLCACCLGFIQHGLLCEKSSMTTDSQIISSQRPSQPHDEISGTTTESDSAISTSDPNTQQQYQASENAGKGSSAGTVAGAAIGGFVLGIMVSLGIMIFLRKRESHGKQNNDCRKVVVNQSYDKDTEFGESSQISNTTDTKQVSHVRPTIREATYSNIKCPSDNDNGDIYNHLNEKENPGADLDDYDHAHPSTDHGATDGDYCHLNSKPERGMEPQQNGDVYDTSGSVQSRYHYFTLENRNVS